MSTRTWYCNVCGEPVGTNDMVGYVRDRSGNYVKGSLGFWHNNEQCGGQYRRMMPADTPISFFMNNIPQYLALWSYEGLDREDCAKMTLICLEEGYSTAVQYYDTAVEQGLIEPNLPYPLLWRGNIDAILEWRREK